MFEGVLEVISSLQGTLLAKQADRVEVDVNGVGYEVLTTARTLRDLPAPGVPVTLKTYLHVREDALQLYGFPDEAERRAFRMLLSVSGVGPKVALSLLNQFPPQALFAALARGEAAVLKSVSGVGQKTAQHLVVELRDKAVKWTGEAPSGGDPWETKESKSFQDTVSALLALGYGAVEARKSALGAAQALGGEATVEDLLRYSLKSL
jgi:Holliday junction DNA helicase RuvA